MCVTDYGYRYYHPELGRWLSRDPIGERGALNLYGLVKNDGSNRLDELGLAILKIEGEMMLPSIGGGLLGDLLSKSKANYEFDLEYFCMGGQPIIRINPENANVSFSGPDAHTLGVGGKSGPVAVGGSLDGGWDGNIWGFVVKTNTCEKSAEGRSDYGVTYQVYVDVYAYEKLTGDIGVLLHGQGEINLHRDLMARHVLNFNLSCCCGEVNFNRGVDYPWVGLLK